MWYVEVRCKGLRIAWGAGGGCEVGCGFMHSSKLVLIECGECLTGWESGVGGEGGRRNGDRDPEGGQ